MERRSPSRTAVQLDHGSGVLRDELTKKMPKRAVSIETSVSIGVRWSGTSKNVLVLQI